ncbi:MAG TPA: hypothetical protein VLQ48_05040 [Chloroflexia bacterium]|nr:hypothetical protein [Chloroflexia bacterium]
MTQQGFPVSDLLQERSEVDGKTYQVQYFERALFELHTENPAPNDVLLALLGTSRYLEYYGPGGAGSQSSDLANPHFFAETGHTIGGSFRTYWQQHGGVPQFGFPISDELIEISNIDGKPYKVQYFQRALFELHPQNHGTPYEVLLVPLGAYRYHAMYGALSIPAPIPPVALQTGLRGSQAYLLWVDAKLGPPDWPPDIFPSVEPTTNWIFNLYTGEAFTATLDSDLYSYLGKDGPYVVWEGACRTSLDCGKDVYGRNLSTGETFPLDLQPGNRRSPVVAGDTAAYIEDSYANNQNQERLVLKNLMLGDTKVIVSQTQNISGFPAINMLQITTEYVVWTESNYIQNGLTIYDLYAYNQKTGQTRHIAQRSGRDLSDILPAGIEVALSGHYLAWTDPALHLVNLESGEAKIIFGQGAYFPVMRGNSLVWNAYDTGTGTNSTGIQIWGAKVSNPNAIFIADQGNYDWGPIIAGDWLVWPAKRQTSGISLHEAFAVSEPGP